MAMRAESPSTLLKPRLRGASHHAAFYVALGAGPTLVASTPTAKTALAAAIYAICMAALFGISALYHRPNWPPATRRKLRRLDHAAIYAMIAGTFTPVGWVGLGGPEGDLLVRAIWLGAALGMLKAVAWINSPPALNAALYLLLGWLGAVSMPGLFARVGAPVVWLLVAGGVAYSIGAVVYALRRPDPIPHVFGYHEVFHVLVLLGCLCHFLAIWQILHLS